MGDGITSTLDIIVFILIFAGVPALVLGLPMLVILFLFSRRNAMSSSELQNGIGNGTSRANFPAWLVAATIMAVTIMAILVFSSSLKTLFGF